MIVNGMKKELKGELTLKQYLLNTGYTIIRVAVELNGDIVPKSCYDQVILNDADTMEIVHFVGGG